MINVRTFDKLPRLVGMLMAGVMLVATAEGALATSASRHKDSHMRGSSSEHKNSGRERHGNKNKHNNNTLINDKGTRVDHPIRIVKPHCKHGDPHCYKQDRGDGARPIKGSGGGTKPVTGTTPAKRSSVITATRREQNRSALTFVTTEIRGVLPLPPRALPLPQRCLPVT